MADEREVTIDTDQLVLEDLEVLSMLADLRKSEWFTHENTGRILDMLDRVVEGGVRGQGYKISELGRIAAAVFDAVNEGPEGNSDTGS